MTGANRPTPANSDNGDDLVARLEAHGGQLRGDPFRTGEVGIEYISGYEAAAYRLRTLAEDSKVARRPGAEETKVVKPDRRLKTCVENWPDAETGLYDPHCCRWPKSCSATICPDDTPDDRLEPA